MSEKEIHINLIFKYLGRETDKEEEKILFDWLEESNENKTIFDEYQKAWNLSSENYLSEINAINVEKEWTLFKNESGFDDKTIKLGSASKKQFSVGRIAAVISAILLLGISALFFLRPTQEVIYADAKIIESTLPDGTEVTINKKSTIKYSKKFNKKNREIELKGDAFFKVEKSDSLPFIIDAQSFFVEVVGTEFYVNSDYKERKVIVKEGIVAVYQYQDKRDKVILHAGEEIIFDKKNNEIRKTENTDVNYLSWKTKIFDFNNKKLEVIFKDLEKAYNVEFKFLNPDLKKCRQTVSFENQDIDQIVNVLNATFDNLSFKKNNNTILVDGESCYSN